MTFTKIILFQLLILAVAHLMMAENEDLDHHEFHSPNRQGEHSEMNHEGMANHTADDEHQSRLFFHSLFNTLSTCNYTSQAGRSCLGCNTALTCFSSNVGIVRNCRGFFRFCNNGACSFFPGSACNSTSTNSTTG